MDGVDDFGAVIAKSTRITNAHRYSFKYDKPLLMLKSFTVNFLGANGALTMLAWITVVTVLSGIF